MKRIALLAGILPLLMTASLPANAAVHEIVAAYCSGGDVGAIDGGGFLQAPGVQNGFSKGKSFAAPVLNSGVVVVNGAPTVTDHPAAKFKPGAASQIKVSESLHPSAQNCPNVDGLP